MRKATLPTNEELVLNCRDGRFVSTFFLACQHRVTQVAEERRTTAAMHEEEHRRLCETVPKQLASLGQALRFREAFLRVSLNSNPWWLSLWSKLPGLSSGPSWPATTFSCTGRSLRERSGPSLARICQSRRLAVPQETVGQSQFVGYGSPRQVTYASDREDRRSSPDAPAAADRNGMEFGSNQPRVSNDFVLRSAVEAYRRTTRDVREELSKWESTVVLPAAQRRHELILQLGALHRDMLEWRRTATVSAPFPTTSSSHPLPNSTRRTFIDNNSGMQAAAATFTTTSAAAATSSCSNADVTTIPRSQPPPVSVEPTFCESSGGHENRAHPDAHEDRMCRSYFGSYVHCLTQLALVDRGSRSVFCKHRPLSESRHCAPDTRRRGRLRPKRCLAPASNQQQQQQAVGRVAGLKIATPETTTSAQEAAAPPLTLPGLDEAITETTRPAFEALSTLSHPHPPALIVQTLTSLRGTDGRAMTWCLKDSSNAHLVKNRKCDLSLEDQLCLRSLGVPLHVVAPPPPEDA